MDWDRRFDNMQQHTGQHLVSALFEKVRRLMVFDLGCIIDGTAFSVTTLGRMTFSVIALSIIKLSIATPKIRKLSLKTTSIVTLSIMTLIIMKLSTRTFSIMILSLKKFSVRTSGTVTFSMSIMKQLASRTKSGRVFNFKGACICAMQLSCTCHAVYQGTLTEGEGSGRLTSSLFKKSGKIFSVLKAAALKLVSARRSTVL